jgi:hypothetical protein
MDLKEKQDVMCVQWVHLAQNINQFWALVNKVTNIQILQNAKNFLD